MYARKVGERTLTLGVSGKLETATKMGGAVIFVMLISSTCAYGIHKLLLAINAPFLQLISCNRRG